MSDLEDLWDDLPTGTPPVDAILREGRASAVRRRLLTRPVIAVAASAALIGAFAAGAFFGEIPGPNRGQKHSDMMPVAFQADLKPAQSCDALLDSYRERAVKAVTAWGWRDQWHGYSGRFFRASGLLDETGDLGSAKRAQSASETGTNVQEVGIDEPDNVKTDGKLVVRLRGNELVVYDASGSAMMKQSSILLPRFAAGEILLVGETVVAIGADRLSSKDVMSDMWRGSRIISIDLADPSKPMIASTVTYSSGVISARQHGSVVRLVLAAGLPELDFTQPQGGKSARREALATNRRVIETSTIEDWLPTFDAGEGSEQLLDCTNVAVPPKTPGLDTVSVVGFDAAAPGKPQAIGLAGAATIAYESADHLYLADSPYSWGCRNCRLDGSQRMTNLYDFELDGVNAVHVASGEVKGAVADRWSMDEANDVLRVAVGPMNPQKKANSLVTFRRDGSELVEAGRLDGLGKNEEIKGVRWFDDLAVLVTYREIDPLFTIDLTEPSAPRLSGELKITGYSDYLHPLSDDLMLGIGYEEGDNWGAQIALFDISDLTNVKRTSVERFSGENAIATWEPRAFTWLPERAAALTVLQEGKRIKIASLTVRDGKLHSTVEEVARGFDASQVRTLALADGRVALVTPDSVRFLMR